MKRRKKDIPIAAPWLGGVVATKASLAGAKVVTFKSKRSPITSKAYKRLSTELVMKHGLKIQKVQPFGNGFFIPKKKLLVFGRGEQGVALHELGHATMLRKSPLGAIRRAAILPAVKLFRGRNSIAVVSGLSGDRKAAPTATLLTVSPLLAEEGIANIQAARAIRKAGGGVKGLKEAAKYLLKSAPAYGTYVGSAAAAAGLAYGVARLFEKKRKRGRR